jgi:TonB-linked SusC/RagA family outer membrane protein
MKKFLLVCFSFVFVLSAWAQEREISGKVTSSEDGSTVPGVNVLLKGTTVGTVTNADGVYKLSVPSSGGTLVFSFIGYQSREEAIGDRSVVDIGLVSDVQQLNEVVVTAVGIPREVRTLGYSVATVKNEYLNQAKVTNIGAALSGKVSGLQINQTDNGVNSPVRIVLRGNRSFLGNNQALIVVDGVQVDQSYLNSLNPNDIETTNVLKGASAAALYGSAASNGVLIINTKKGGNLVPEIQVNSVTQVETVSYLPKLQTQFGMNGGEGFGSAGNYAVNPNFSTPYTAYENQNYGPQFNGKLVPLGLPLYDPKTGKYDDQQYTTYSSKYNDHLNFWNHAVTTQNGVTFSAGDKNNKYFVSVQDVNKKGVVPKDVFRRDVLRFNGTHNYGIFHASYGINYTLSDQNTTFAANVPTPPAFGSTARFNTVYWFWLNTGMNVPLTQYKDWQNNRYASPSGWYDEFYPNPYWVIDNYRQQQTTNDLLGTLELSLQPTKWFNILGRVGVTSRGQHTVQTNGPISFDPLIVPQNSSRLSTPGAVPAGVNDAYYQNKRINADFLATFSHKIADQVDFKAILGNNIFDDYTTNNNVASYNLLPLNPVIYNTTYRNGNLSGGSATSRNRRVSVYGDLTATWKYLTVHGSWRNDWVSLLATNNRSFNYPEVDFAFVFTDAIPALKDNQIISFGKVSGSYAKVGNVNVGPYSLYNVFAAGTPYSANGNVPVLYQGTSAISANLTPEFTTQREVDLDMGFWENKINFKAAYYQSNTIHQTVSFGVSNATGYSRALINTGEMFNQGLEFDLNVTPISTPSGFKLTVGGNYTNLNNKVLSIYTSATGDKLNSIQITDNSGTTTNALNVQNSYAIVGQQYPVIQTNDWLRDPQGRVIVDGSTGLPTRNPNLSNFGQANPRYRLGLNTNASYKGFSLSVLFDYRGGNVIYNQLGQDIEFGGLGYKSATAGRQRFVYPNSVIKQADGSYTPNTNVTVNDGNVNFWANIYNTVGGNYVTSANFWKLREIALAYDVPTAILEKTKAIKKARVSLTGRNLFMWRPKSNQWTDPEFSGDNSNSVGTTSAFQNPPTRIYGINVNLTF